MVARLLFCLLLIAGLAGCAGRPDHEAHRLASLRMVDAGLLRLDTDPPDAPFDNTDLKRHFELIALYSEIDLASPGGGENSRPGPLWRWSDPIRWALVGGGVTPADRDEVVALFDQIAAATGLDIAEAGPRDVANFVILFTTPGERRVVSARLNDLSRPVGEVFDQWRRSPAIICAGVFGGTGPQTGDISVAFVFLGDELFGRLRRACIHEEIAQAMGLPNDHPDVRPSIFNDDQEFALLTVHDKWLLRILYHPTLQPGMRAAEVRPLLPGILAALRPEPQG